MAVLRMKDSSQVPAGSTITAIGWTVRTGSHTGSIVRQFSGAPNARASATNVTGLNKDALLDVTAAGLSFPLYVTMLAIDQNTRAYTWQGIAKPITFIRDFGGFYIRDVGSFYIGVPN